MCLQCSTEAVSYKTQVVPGYWLMRATKDAWPEEPKEWRKDRWALVRCNDPEFVFDVMPIPDPEFGLSEEDADKLPNDACMPFLDALGKFRDDFYLPAMNGYELVEACKKAGWKDDADHGTVMSWLFHRMGVIVRDEVPYPHDTEEEDD
jgi:hypothetical protein